MAVEEGSLLPEKQLGDGPMDPHAQPEDHQAGMNLPMWLLPWVWDRDRSAFLRNDCVCVIHAVWPVSCGRLSNTGVSQPFTGGKSLCLWPLHHQTGDGSLGSGTPIHNDTSI